MSCCSNHGPGHDKNGGGAPLFWIALIGLGGILVYLNWNSLLDSCLICYCWPAR